jgi:hypothetical protein
MKIYSDNMEKGQVIDNKIKAKDKKRQMVVRKNKVERERDRTKEGNKRYEIKKEYQSETIDRELTKKEETYT